MQIHIKYIIVFVLFLNYCSYKNTLSMQNEKHTTKKENLRKTSTASRSTDEEDDSSDGDNDNDNNTSANSPIKLLNSEYDSDTTLKKHNNKNVILLSDDEELTDGQNNYIQKSRKTTIIRNASISSIDKINIKRKNKNKNKNSYLDLAVLKNEKLKNKNIELETKVSILQSLLNEKANIEKDNEEKLNIISQTSYLNQTERQKLYSSYMDLLAKYKVLENINKQLEVDINSLSKKHQQSVNEIEFIKEDYFKIKKFRLFNPFREENIILMPDIKSTDNFKIFNTDIAFNRTGGYIGYISENKIFVQETLGSKIDYIFSSNQILTSLQFSNIQDLVYLTYSNTNLKCWDPVRPENTIDIKFQTISDDEVNIINFGPNQNDAIISINTTKGIYLWDQKSNKKISLIKPYKENIKSKLDIVFSSGAVWGSEYQLICGTDRSIKIFDLRNQSSILENHQNSKFIEQIETTKSKPLVIYSDTENILRAWNYKKNKNYQLPNTLDEQQKVKYFPKSNFVFSNDADAFIAKMLETKIVIWDFQLKYLKSIDIAKKNRKIMNLAICPNTRYIAASLTDKQIKIFTT